MRRQDWPRRLQAFVRARRNMPFAWGTNDCVTLAADWVEECTGVHIEREWTDALSAMREIERRGGLRQAVSDVLGEPIPVTLAQRGDLVLIDLGGRETMAVCVGEYALAASEMGALLHPVSDAVSAWRVA